MVDCLSRPLLLLALAVSPMLVPSALAASPDGAVPPTRIGEAPLGAPVRLGPPVLMADGEDAGSSGSSSGTATREERGSGSTGSTSSGSSSAADDAGSSASSDSATAKPTTSRQKPPVLAKNAKITIDFVDAPLSDVVKYMAEITGRNFILNDKLKGEVTIISHQPVSVSEAYEAFLSAMEMEGFTTVTVGKATKVVSTSDAASNPLRVYEGANIPYTDNYVTQIIQFENVQVSEITSVVKDLSGKGAKIIAYAPTNTLIITDAAVNIRRVYRIISQLDVASPKSKLALIPLSHATAADIERIIKDLYGSADSTSSSSKAGETSASRRRAARERASSRRRKDTASKTASAASASSVGSEGKYIEKIISDERTNSLIVMANEEALKAVQDLINSLDVDVDPQSRAQIRVRYLEHAKAEDVAQVLSQLSEGGSSSSKNSKQSAASRNRRNNAGKGPQGGPGGRGPFGGDTGSSSGESTTSAVAAFDSGVRITSDENTNSLVIIATRDQFSIIEQVIGQLDIPRKQVFVEAVILELSTSDEFNFGLGVHLGKETADFADKGPGIGVGGAGLNGTSITGPGGLAGDLLSGMAVGVFGPSIPVDGVEGGVPAFGIVLNALQSNGSVNIVSTPNLLTMDNEEAKIVVGRNVPFPVGTGRDNNNNPIISFQREDVAITLKVTPQINESNYVTLEVFQEVQEIESDTSNLDPLTSGGPTTSKRSVESTVVVKDNQTIVLGGLIGETESDVETKVPVLGDLPLVGRLFRGHNSIRRKTNLLIFLTPHIINEPGDLEEVYRIKVAQRQEFLRRFYGESREAQEAEMRLLLSYSMNQVSRPSRYRGPTLDDSQFTPIHDPLQDVPDQPNTNGLPDAGLPDSGLPDTGLPDTDLPDDAPDFGDLPAPIGG
jgi:general secretion pathway protein D